LFINFTKGIYAVLDDMLKSDVPTDFADIFPSVIEGNKFEGKTFSLPDVVHPGGNIAVNYNKTLLKEKGLDEPKPGWTLTDWEALARNAADPVKVLPSTTPCPRLVFVPAFSRIPSNMRSNSTASPPARVMLNASSIPFS